MFCYRIYLLTMFRHRVCLLPTLILNIIFRCDVLSSNLLIPRHLFHVIFLSLKRCFTITYVYCWCFAIAHVCYPTLIFNIIVRCDVLSSGLLTFRHLFHVILPSFHRCFPNTYSFVDASPSHILLADVSPSHMFVILLWLLISL